MIERRYNMSTKKSFFVLFFIDLILIGVYTLYIVIPEELYLGYYPIGIIQIILMVGTIISLVIYIKNWKIKSNKGKLKKILLIIGYVISIIWMVYSLFIWYAFLPR